MTRITYRRLAVIAAVAMFIGCQTGMKSVAAVKADAPKPQATTSSQQQSSPAKTANAESSGPKTHTTFFRADSKPTAMPPVVMSKADQAACKVKVGDAMPAIELPKLGGTDKTKLADLLGKKATVVVFWKGDRRMSHQQLTDLGADVIAPLGKQGVAVVGIAVDESAKDAAATFKKTGATFTNLHDADGKAFAKIGSGRFPRTYLLDPSGKIVWFDIEYSLATRRELHQALRAIAGDK